MALENLNATFLLFFCQIILFCKQPSFQGQKLNASSQYLALGERLAKKHCGSCHLVPEADSLDQETTHYMLTYMGLFLGMKGVSSLALDQAYLIQLQKRRELLTFLKLIPPKPQLSAENWSALRNYYLFQAASFARPSKVHLLRNNSFANQPFNALQDQAITAIKIDRRHKRIYLGLGWQGKIAICDFKGKILKTIKVSSAPVHFEFSDHLFYVTLIGDLLGNHAGVAKGEVVFFNKNWQRVGRLKGLYRSTHATSAPLFSGSGKQVVVSEFGTFSDGALTVHYQQEKHWRQKTLLKENGVLRSQIFDANKDGLNDIMALQAGADEKLLLYLNRGDFTFEKRIILRRGPSQGFTSFLARDLDGDGDKDIVLLSGDNADAGPFNPSKKKHGVEILENQNASFVSKAFTYLPGAYFAKAADIDLDSDIDLIVSSYYPRINNLESRMVIFKNQGNLQFEAQTLPIANVRPLVFDVADLDGDGDLDILYSGNGLAIFEKTLGQIKQQNFRKEPNLYLLINKLR